MSQRIRRKVAGVDRGPTRSRRKPSGKWPPDDHPRLLPSLETLERLSRADAEQDDQTDGGQSS